MKKKVNLTDGIEVASMFMTYYINSLCFKEGPFVERMRQQDQKIQENLTYLMLAWLHSLSASSFDASNEGAVMMSRDVCLHVPQLPKLNQLAYTGDCCREVEFFDDRQVAEMMAGYLAADSKNAYKDFLLYAMMEEGTLQQVLARVSRAWLEKSVECPTAQEASRYCFQHTLPYI